MSDRELPHDADWEALLEEALRQKNGARPRPVPRPSEIHSRGRVPKWLRTAVAIFLIGASLHVLNRRLLGFSREAWEAEGQDKFGDRATQWRRFEFQHRIIGMKKQELLQLLGVPDGKSPNKWTYNRSLISHPYIELRFKDEAVVSYRSTSRGGLLAFVD